MTTTPENKIKILTIADLHGRDVWKKFADINFLLNATDPETAEGYTPEYDKYVFLGDYTDSFTETNVVIKHNLLELIRFKKLYPKNVILLLGNHDVQYFLNQPWNRNLNYLCSGFRPEAHFDLYDIFNQNKDLFQLAYQVKNYLFTHAGVHFGWYQYTFKKAIKGLNLDDLSVADQLNEAFNLKLDCIFDVDWYRGGNKKVGGPLWCDKKLLSKILKNTNQVVGHTPVNEIKTINIKNSSITFCDVLHHKTDFYTLAI